MIPHGQYRAAWQLSHVKAHGIKQRPQGHERCRSVVFDFIASVLSWA
jgi:hypothetical protein